MPSGTKDPGKTNQKGPLQQGQDLKEPGYIPMEDKDLNLMHGRYSTVKLTHCLSTSCFLTVFKTSQVSLAKKKLLVHTDS